MKEQQRSYRSTRYEFDAGELRKLGEDLAREAVGVYELERQKKELTAELSASLKAANGRVASLARRLHQGFEDREVEVDFVFDAPREGVKQVIDINTGRVIDTEPMTPQDRQQSLDME